MAATYKNIPVRAGNTAMPLTVRKRLAILYRHLPAEGGRFLDCGCGTGEYIRLLNQRHGLDVCGVEYDPMAAKRVQTDQILKDRLFQGDLQNLQFPDESWHYAMLNEVLEHVADDRKTLEETRRILKPGGWLFVFSPNRWFPFETHGVDLKKIGRRIHWLPFIPYLPLKFGALFYSSWAKNYWQREMKELLENSGFIVLERDYIWPTFENLSGNQPKVFKVVRPVLRFVSNTLEKTPFLRRFGVTQAFVCRKA
jgi:ubiquinone/menaquinone biosynthesis C-methylase UbiE